MSGWWMLQVLVSCKYLHEKRIPEVYCGIDKNNKKDKLAKSFYSGYVLSITHKALRGNRVWWFRLARECFGECRPRQPFLIYTASIFNYSKTLLSMQIKIS
jgi:hypothetical protein